MLQDEQGSPKGLGLLPDSKDFLSYSLSSSGQLGRGPGLWCNHFTWINPQSGRELRSGSPTFASPLLCFRIRTRDYLLSTSFVCLRTRENVTANIKQHPWTWRAGFDGVVTEESCSFGRSSERATAIEMRRRILESFRLC